ncbi:MAG: rhodanese-like domain-containing protein [Sulfuricellaceae bacterium]|nr:rhodanese-like domain-containing protein [Sulfuricellaceae bacterium]
MSFHTPLFAKRGLLAFTATAALIFSNIGFAADTPASLQGATVVDAAKAKSLMDSGVKLFDTRVANEYAEGHIKGAINIPYKEKSAKSPDFDASQDSFDLSKLPSDKNTPVIFQCNGPECWKSFKSAHVAIKAGYKKVYWFRGGFPEWKAKGLPTE